MYRMLKTKPTPGDSSWYTHSRLGMFIHWGIYANAGRHEWVQNYEEIPGEEYQKYFDHFDPDLYDPDQWAQFAADAGMKYFVITTKHHDGFCLWDSKLTDFKVTNTPYGKDLIGPMVEAFRARNIRVGFYHSLIDWHHPQFPIDAHHPLRNHPDKDKINKSRNVKIYAEYLHGQVRELLTQFGKIDVLFTDFSYRAGTEGWPADFDGKGRDDWQSEILYGMIRELMPDVMLNDRMDIDEGWDIKTPEQITPQKWLRVDGEPVTWECCHTFSGSWGYHRDEETWKSVEQLLYTLIGVVSCGGNLLLNVGPTGLGTLDHRAIERLAGMGEWMKLHSRSIYGCTQAPEDIPVPRDGRLTYNPKTNRLYMHIFSWPFKYLMLDGLVGRVNYAQLLNDGSEVSIGLDEWHAHQAPRAGIDPKTTLVLELPVKKPNVAVPVVELFLK